MRPLEKSGAFLCYIKIKYYFILLLLFSCTKDISDDRELVDLAVTVLY